MATARKRARKRERGRDVAEGEIAKAVELMADGLTLKECCEKAGLQYRNVMRRIKESETLREAYGEARIAYAHAIFDRMIEVAKTEEDVKRARLLVDTYKWQAAKVIPKIYGDKITQEHTGPDGGPIEFSNMTDEQLNARITACAREVMAADPDFKLPDGLVPERVK